MRNPLDFDDEQPIQATNDEATLCRWLMNANLLGQLCPKAILKTTLYPFL